MGQTATNQGIMTKAAFGDAFRNGHQRTIHFLKSRGLEEQEAQEVAQAAWVKGWERRGQIKDNNKALAWINTIALNLSRNRFKRQNRHDELPELSTPPANRDAAIDVKRVLRRCSHGERQLLEERYLKDASVEELAQEHDCSRGAIRIRLYRARNSFRNHLQTQASARRRSSRCRPRFQT